MSAFNALTSCYHPHDMATARAVAREPHLYDTDDRKEARSLLLRFGHSGSTERHNEAYRFAERLAWYDATNTLGER